MAQEDLTYEPIFEDNFEDEIPVVYLDDFDDDDGFDADFDDED